MVQGALHLKQELVGHGSRKAVADEDALDDEIFAVRWHGIGRNQPAAPPQPVGVVIEGEARGNGVFQFPTQAGNSSVAVVNNLEGSEAAYLFGEIAAQVITTVLNFAVALFAET